jgi:uncharacterized cofD-like protein
VAVGGGHGLSTTLRAVRRYAGTVTAVVSVADDGGSSGRLRDALGVPAPGDVRRCLAALAAGDSPLARALEHRMRGGDLGDHPLGNLLLAGLSETEGDFVVAVDEVARLVGAVGRVLPATVEPVSLVGEGVDGPVLGQVAIKQRGARLVWVDPPEPATPPAAVDAILGADQVVLGPGSLYTSVLAAAVVPAVRDALVKTSAQRVYVLNLGQEHAETLRHDAVDHVEALARHGIPIDVVVRHEGSLPGRPLPGAQVELVVAREGGLAHDPGRLAATLADLAAGILRPRAPTK